MARHWNRSRIVAVKGPAKFELKANSPKFWDLIAPNTKLETIANGFGFTEGPVWDERGFLYVSDEVTNKIFKLFPDGHHEDIVSLGDPDGNTYDKQHRLIDCASVLRAIIAVDPDGKYKVLADRYQGKKFNSPNDVVLGPDGALYFTDPTLDLVKGEKQELPYQGVFRLGADGKVRLLIKDMAQPNGLAFSPDGRKLYVDDSERKEIRVWDVTRDGGVRNGRLFRKIGWPRRPRRHAHRHARKSLCHRPIRHLGLGRCRHASGHHRAARANRKPDLGRSRLRNLLHHLQHLGAETPHQSKRIRPV